MASWTMPPPRPDSLDRDANFFWHDMEGMSDDYHNDFLGEFVDFEAASQPFASGGTAHSQAHPLNLAMPTMPDAPFLDHHTESSSGFTTGDEFDLGSASSQAGMTMSAGSHEVDPQALVMEPLHLEYVGRESISDSDLPKLDGMTLYSPTKVRAVSRPVSPTADEKGGGRGHKLVEALSSTIKKATTLRRGKKQVPDRSGSPTIPDVPAGKLPRQRKSSRRNGGSAAADVGFPSPPGALAMAEDPFIEPIHPPEARYFVAGYGKPLESPGVKSESAAYANDATAAHMSSDNWPLPNPPNSAPAQWNDPTVEYLRGQAAGSETVWWDVDLQQQQMQGPHIGQLNKHAQMNMVMHTQHGEIPYEYAAMQDPSAGGLMIQMPQPRQGSTVIITNDHEYDQHHRQQHSHLGGGIAMSDQAYLPPPPPIPSDHNSPAHSPDRSSNRPPRAKSSGARHLSCSPVRKSRSGAASSSTSPGPNQSSGGPGHGQQTPRHSSSGSAGSTRSASGRLPASMPGTPCSIRKRRSSANLTGTSTSPTKASHSRRTSSTAAANGGNQRRPSLNNLRSASASATSSANGVNLGGGGLGGGFVNFTPSDGSVLMTGVAPSGSSKTKARREKEAMERRRKLSEAAMKAVRDAGGDVEKLIEEGFAF